MHKIKINSETGSSTLIIGGSVRDLLSYLPDKKLFIITDNNVRKLYGNTFPPGEVLNIESGEQSKSLEVIGELCRRLIEQGADRSSFILGFGGGVVCDVAGMVASVYMRGVRHGFVSTTLLSQVDASIGGKTGVNLGPYKNIIGTFRQPEFVICDQTMLSTLSEEEYLSGLGELVKHAVIGDRELYFDISDNLKKLLERNPASLEDIIYRSVKIKAMIVRRDPLEKGSRRLLNFGHTFGHPVEMANHLPHGIAVMKGMIIASELSVWCGEMPLVEQRLLVKMMSQLTITSDDDLPADVMSLITRDKKSETGFLNVVLLRAIGKAVIRKIPFSEIEAFLGSRVKNNL
ncbi:MAG TPA: 3-dehydroquinate synthase family protein [Bacteroidales bacterium]|nr:3-dehydroquinate synthase family protein [Bacteroidales bacterium]